MNIVWVLIVTGSQFSGLTYSSASECQYYAQKLGGTCQPVAAAPQNPPQPPNDGGFSLYQQCVATGACPPLGGR